MDTIELASADVNLPNTAVPTYNDVLPQGSSSAGVFTDLSAWKGQRILARSGCGSVYRPGVIDSISSNDQPVGVLLDGEAEPCYFRCGLIPDIIGDYAPAAAMVVKGTRVCVRCDTSNCEFYVGTVSERTLNQFFVELEGGTSSSAKSILVSRANLRLLQVV